MNDGQHTRLIGLIRNNALTYRNLFAGMTDEDATTFRDSGDGWTALEVLCHVHDFDRIFHNRARLILGEDNPQLPAFDHEELARERNYNAQDPAEEIAALLASREDFADLFQTLEPENWTRSGIHPERDTPFTLEDALIQVCTHDADHIEQITRILAERLTSPTT